MKWNCVMPWLFFSTSRAGTRIHLNLNRQILKKTRCDFHLCTDLILLSFSSSNFMRQECLDSRFVFDRPLPVSRLVSLIGSSILLKKNNNNISQFKSNAKLKKLIQRWFSFVHIVCVFILSENIPELWTDRKAVRRYAPFHLLMGGFFVT